MKAQTNYVYNGDFELYNLCPTQGSTPWDLQINRCLGWTTPTFATSDYFNICSSGITASVPLNNLGYQAPFNGSGYCGFFGCSYDTVSNYQWWEYIQGSVMPLNIGEEYKISFELNLAEDAYYIIDKIGIYISSSQFTDLSTTLPLTQILPQFETPNGFLIDDTTNWMHFEWNFIADGNEKFITIGNFNDFFNSNAILAPQNGTNGNSYIFIDNVSIVKSDNETSISNIFSPNNDGINDNWHLPFSNMTGEITIINRWGTKVLTTSCKNFSWNGNDTNNTPCNDGVYYFITTNKEKKEKTGFIQLMR